MGAPCTLPPTLTPVDRNKAYCFRQDKFVVVDESTRNNVCYDRSVLPLQVRVGLNSVITLHVYKDLLDCIDDRLCSGYITDFVACNEVRKEVLKGAKFAGSVGHPMTKMLSASP